MCAEAYQRLWGVRGTGAGTHPDGLPAPRGTQQGEVSLTIPSALLLTGGPASVN